MQISRTVQDLEQVGQLMNHSELASGQLMDHGELASINGLAELPQKLNE